MIISVIAAIGKNRELGKNNKLLWKIPGDLIRFKKITTGHTVIMGRKTFESIGKPLVNRTNIVITRDAYTFMKNHLVSNGVHESGSRYRKSHQSSRIQQNKGNTQTIVVSSLHEAIELAKEYEKEEIFIIGGGQIYKQALPLTDRLYLTLVDKIYPDADTFFPKYTALFPKVISREKKREKLLSYVYEIRVR